ncbi:Uncharacterized spore protein YtfJ [Lachnospiraceae bacterium]|nr:Uncharacterized spore protein YtfJ [Lachnospiraceae bacterium]
MADKKVDEVIGQLMNGMGSFLSSKTVVGEPIVLGDTTLIPLVEVSFGMGVGTGIDDKKGKSGGGIGGKMSPSSVLVLHDGKVRLVNVKNQDTMTKILDMIPELVNKFTEPKPDSTDVSDADAVDIAFDRTENG